MPALRFSVDGKHFETFSKTITSRQPGDFPARDFPKHQSTMIGDCCVFKVFWRRVGGKHLMRFQGKTNVLKFLRRIVRTGPKVTTLNTVIKLPVKDTSLAQYP